MPSHPRQDHLVDLAELSRRLTATQNDLDEWRAAHRSLAAMLGSTDRGRDHCDARLIITAIKRAFRITRITVEPDASVVHITTADGNVRRVPIAVLDDDEAT